MISHVGHAVCAIIQEVTFGVIVELYSFEKKMAEVAGIGALVHDFISVGCRRLPKPLHRVNVRRVWLLKRVPFTYPTPTGAPRS